jgi:hypothetical protein
MSRYGPSDWNQPIGQGGMMDRFGQNERTGVGARSLGSRRSDDALREQLLDELSVLRRRHDTLQQRNRSSMLDSPPLSGPPVVGHHQLQQPSSGLGGPQIGTYFSGPLHQSREDTPTLDQSDKDAIEALFAVDDFAEIFNAGGNVISNLPTMPVEHQAAAFLHQAQPQSQGQPQQQQSSLAPVCHMCCRKLRPSEVAAYVNTAVFDPSKPTARRKLKPKQ